MDQFQLKPNNKIELSTYHQQIKITNTWLPSMSYKNPILSYENLSKAVTRLPNYLCTQFYKVTPDCDLVDGTTNLLSFETWLEKRIKHLFYSLAGIVPIKEATSKHQQHPKYSFQRKMFSNSMSNNADKKEKEKRVQTNMKYKETNGTRKWREAKERKIKKRSKDKEKQGKTQIDGL